MREGHAALERLRGEERKLATAALDQGWRAQETRKGVRLLSPDGTTTASIHTSQSDIRAMRNLKAQLRRGGFRDVR